MAATESDSSYGAIGIAVIFFVVTMVIALVIEWALFGGDQVLLALGTGAAFGGLFTVLALLLARY